jgi:hypothetical protein
MPGVRLGVEERQVIEVALARDEPPGVGLSAHGARRGHRGRGARSGGATPRLCPTVWRPGRSGRSSLLVKIARPKAGASELRVDGQPDVVEVFP